MAKRGPKRSEAARIAILSATVGELAAKGYDGLSIEAVAAAAGVGKQTIYRWWPSKGALIAECLIEGLIPSPAYAPPDTGDLATDLTSWLTDAIVLIDEPPTRELIRALTSASLESPVVAARVDATVASAPGLAARLESARAAGELSADAPVEPLVTAIIGSLTLRILSPDPTPPGFVGGLVALVVRR